MSKLLFRLRNVPDDEVSEVRDLLARHNIEFYETSEGNWGISMPGIWLHNDSDYTAARRLLDAYQQERTQRMRAIHERERAEGTAETQWQRLREEPAKVVGYLTGIAILLYLSIRIFY